MKRKGGVFVNLPKLNGKIVESGIKKNYIAKKFNISIQALNKKLSGKTKISVDEALKFCDILHIDDFKEKNDIFLS